MFRTQYHSKPARRSAGGRADLEAERSAARVRYRGLGAAVHPAEDKREAVQESYSPRKPAD